MAVTRRDFGRSVLASIAATSMAGVGGCGSDGGSGSTGGSGGTAGTGGATGAGGMNSCTVYPQQTAGPFYLDLDSLRRDITEGKLGADLRVQVRVQAADCSPLKDLAVDLWHCDADGVYSGFPGQLGGLDTTRQTFLRGTQVTDADGVVEFETIFPGWYPGRTTHIHFKVHQSSSMEATSQIYFPEALTSRIYETEPYDARGQKDTPNAIDGIASTNPAPLAEVTGDASLGYVATVLVTVA